MSESLKIGFCGLLALVFITLKLCGVIAWGWVWVLSPLWLPLALALAICAFAFVFGLIAAACGQK